MLDLVGFTLILRKQHALHSQWTVKEEKSGVISPCFACRLLFIFCIAKLCSLRLKPKFSPVLPWAISAGKSLAFPPLVGRSHRETQQSSGSAQLIFKTVRLSSILLLLIHNEPFGSSGHTFAPQSWTRQEGPLYQAGGSMKELTCHVWVSGWLVIEVGPFTILSLERPLHGSLGMCSKNFLSKSKSSTSTTSHWPYALENMYQLLYHHFCGNNYIPKDCVLEERGPNPSVGPIGSMFGFNKSCWILMDSGKFSDGIQNASFQKMYPAHWSWALSSPNGLDFKSR